MNQQCNPFFWLAFPSVIEEGFIIYLFIRKIFLAENCVDIWKVLFVIGALSHQTIHDFIFWIYFCSFRFPAGVPWKKYSGELGGLSIHIVVPGKDKTLGLHPISFCSFDVQIIVNKTMWIMLSIILSRLDNLQKQEAREGPQNGMLSNTNEYPKEYVLACQWGHITRYITLSFSISCIDCSTLNYGCF